MPLPALLLLTVAAGIATALAGRVELRMGPRPSYQSRAFVAFALYICMVLVPVSLYFYMFHGDWFVLYLVDVQTIPSAVVLLACLGQILLGVVGFLMAAALIRGQREQIAGGAIGACIAAAGAVLAVARERLGVVGTYQQFRGDFGLAPYGGALLQGSLWMGLWVVLGLGFLLYRLGPGSSRI